MAANVDSLLCNSFPLRKGATGYFALSTGQAAVDEIIEQVLGTVPGERPMRPTFGCDLHRHLFQPADQAQAATAKSDIAEALRLWVPWITVEGGTKGIEVTIDHHTVQYTIRYRLTDGTRPAPIEGEIALRT